MEGPHWPLARSGDPKAPSWKQPCLEHVKDVLFSHQNRRCFGRPKQGFLHHQGGPQRGLRASQTILKARVAPPPEEKRTLRVPQSLPPPALTPVPMPE